jgi:hypothetical protein
MSSRTEKSPKKQVRRVAAWIYTVLNPIIECLQRELSLLDSGNLTWRSNVARSEVIRTIQEYVDPAQWPNYQTFFAEHLSSPLVLGFKEHDSELLKLETVAQLLFNQLLSTQEFLIAVDQALDIYEGKRESLGPQAPALTHMRKDVPRIAAEYLINNVQNLPSHYLLSAFWNSAGMNLFHFRNRREFEPLSRSRARLSTVSAKLKAALESYRLALSRDYDVPAAPVPGISFEE